MALQVKGGQGKRYKQFTGDTAQAIHDTCNSIVSLCRCLLRLSHNYVLLRIFSTYPLEKEFGKLREGSGGTYFITVQQIMEKVNISKASLLLSANVNIDSFNIESGHSCFNCSFLLDENSAEIFDGLPELESSVLEDTKMVLVYIAGYITRNDSRSSEEKLLNETIFYHQKYGQYLDAIDRVGLNIQTDNTCQWSIFCFMLFNAVKEKVCRKSFSNLCMLVSEYYDFETEKRHGVILSNILLKDLAKVTSPHLGKEPTLSVSRWYFLEILSSKLRKEPHIEFTGS